MDAGVFPFKNLVFEGGGVKGVAYAGGLDVLETRGIRANVTSVAGTSAGAITAALVAAGYTAAELTSTMMALDLRTFEDGRLEGPVRVLERYGWYKGGVFLDWLRARLAEKLGAAEITFVELQRRTGMDLRVVASDLSTHRPVTFSPASTPDAVVAEAVRMSMSIPLFFAAVEQGGSVYVDGGAVWNYPIEIFDPPTGPDGATLGFHLGLLGKAPPPPTPIHNLEEYGRALYETITRVQADYFERTQVDVNRSVFIDDLGLKATDFGITKEQKLALIAEGTKATTAYLDRFGTGSS